MRFSISFYSNDAYQEFLLPSMENTEISIVLSEKIFQIQKDIEVRLENIDGEWFFEGSEEYKIRENKETTIFEDGYGKALSANQLLIFQLNTGKVFSIMIDGKESPFAVYEKYSISNLQEITIGKDVDNLIYYDEFSLVSQYHAKIVKQQNYYILEDLSSNGVYINAQRVRGSWKLSFGDYINIYGLKIMFLGDMLAIDASQGMLSVNKNVMKQAAIFDSLDNNNQENLTYKKNVFRRAPRHLPKIEKDAIEIEAPPQPQKEDDRPLLMMIGPSITMALPMLLGCGLAIYSTQASGGKSSAFMFTGIVTAVCSAVMGTFWAIRNMNYSKKKHKEEELHRFEAYGDYLIKKANEIKEKYEKNTEALKEMYPAASECCQYNEETILLWNRNNSHDDFLTERLGIGELPFQANISIPKEKFTLINDSLAEKPKYIYDNYKTLFDVPVCINLFEHHLIGLIGGEKKKGAHTVVHNLIAQIAANNCYTDVKIGYVYNESENDEFSTIEYLKWLPHAWSEDKKTRFIAQNKEEASEIFYELTGVFRSRMENMSNIRNEKIVQKPYYILFVSDPKLLEGELITKYIMDGKDAYGLTTLLLVENYSDLPNECEFIIQNDDTFSGMYDIEDAKQEKIAIQYDEISTEEVLSFAKTLGNIEVSEVETGGGIPNALTFFEMYGIEHLKDLNVLSRWRRNKNYDNMKVLVGQKTGGKPCYLDVHEKYHGPHGLIAGTTGSGKSETLQTYILSLALNFSPDDVGFFIIDYKGGGMANLFSDLPHMIGQISNLSGNQVHRAMVSIKSENRRRQRIFNEHGVNNINLYTQLYKNNEAKLPIPHMFIIIDEFAELKREEPDFMRELISVAQVGRSLGVHLILATQKPSGTVDDNIWSNSKFRLCLRVQDRQDSNDMLHKPDAAYITQAGRCYLQVGNDELYELFQSGWSGAVYDENIGSAKTDIAKMISNTGKASLIGSKTKIKNKEEARILWIAQLIYIFEDVAKEENYNCISDIHDSNRTAKIIKRMFMILADNQIDYPESEYNARRINNLINIYATAMETYQEGTDDKVLMIIEIAVKTGAKLPEIREKTQLDAVVEYLDKLAKANGFVHHLQLWLPVLPTFMYLDGLQGYEQTVFHDGAWNQQKNDWTLETMIGLYDDPINQAQMPMVLDVAENGNHAICGTVATGKSTFLQTYIFSLICRYSPDMINIYALDFSSKMLSAFESAAHVGGVIYDEDEEEIAKFFTMLQKNLEERKKLFSGGNYRQYYQSNGPVIPAVIVVIDNYAGFRSKTNDKYNDLLMKLTKDGVSYGIFFVITAGGFGMTEIPNKIADNFRTVISLEMNDKFQYADVMRSPHLDVMPEVNVKGRGIAYVGESILEFQTAVSVESDNDFARIEKIRKVCEKMNASWKGKTAKKIPRIPEKPVWNEFKETEEVKEMFAEKNILPVGYVEKDASIYGIDLKSIYCYVISGKSRSGKTNMLKILLMSAMEKKGKRAVIDFSSELESIANKTESEYVSNDEELLKLCQELQPAFIERNKMKKSLQSKGLSDYEIYEEMCKFEPIFLFIGNLPDFIEHAMKPKEGIERTEAFLINIIEKGALHNVFWFASYNQDDYSSMIGKSLHNAFIKDRKGIHFGGNVAAQKVLNFDGNGISYMEQGKVLKAGIGLLPVMEENDVDKVVIPVAKTDAK